MAVTVLGDLRARRTAVRSNGPLTNLARWTCSSTNAAYQKVAAIIDVGHNTDPAG